MWNLKPLSHPVFFFALACERTFSKTYNIEIRCVIGWKMYCLQAPLCIFQPGSFTGWVSEGVKGTYMWSPVNYIWSVVASLLSNYILSVVASFLNNYMLSVVASLLNRFCFPVTRGVGRHSSSSSGRGRYHRSSSRSPGPIITMTTLNVLRVVGQYGVFRVFGCLWSTQRPCASHACGTVVLSKRQSRK